MASPYGVIDATSAIAADAEGPVLRLDYAPGARISRLNKGLRRRRDKSLLGFGIDPATGRWVGGDIDDTGNADPDEPIKQRIVPIVQDNKNAVLIRLQGEPLDATAMATLQHALARGLELEFELEEGELLTEPLPSRDRRRAILAFESTEGGAGVLGRLANEERAVARVARAALDLMHYGNIDAAIAADDPSLLLPVQHADCVRACYRCLLSYYDQPDHELIDRTNPHVLRVLLRLARSEVATPVGKATPHADDPWLAAFEHWGMPVPQGNPLALGGRELRFVWPNHLVAADIGPFAAGIAEAADSIGYTVIGLPEQPPSAPPEELAALLGATA